VVREGFTSVPLASRSSWRTRGWLATRKLVTRAKGIMQQESQRLRRPRKDRTAGGAGAVTARRQ